MNPAVFYKWQGFLANGKKLDLKMEHGAPLQATVSILYIF